MTSQLTVHFVCPSMEFSSMKSTNQESDSSELSDACLFRFLRIVSFETFATQLFEQHLKHTKSKLFVNRIVIINIYLYPASCCLPILIFWSQYSQTRFESQILCCWLFLNFHIRLEYPTEFENLIWQVLPCWELGCQYWSLMYLDF